MKFLVLYKSDATAEQQMAESTPEQAEAGMAEWMAWHGKAESAIVDFGSPVGPASAGADASIGGYSVLEADSREALDAVLEGHPHLQIGTIDVHEFLALPGM
jgi:hypothetical protein